MDRSPSIASVSTRNRRIYAGLWGFVIGVLLASLMHVPPLVCVLVIAAALVAYFAERHAIVLIFLCALALGALRFDIKDFHESLPMGSTGVVASEPEHRDLDTRFVFESDNGERALVSTDLLSGVQYGERVEMAAKFEKPGVTYDGVSKPFDYAAYLSKDDIYYTASFARVTQIAESPSPAHGQASGNSRSTGSRLISDLLKIKNSFVGKMKQILPEPESSLLAGLVVAGKQALPKSIQDEFRRAGVVHIVVLSGYNVTIIAEFFLILLGFMGKRRAAIGSALGIILFTLMTGATATVVRAAIMVLLLLIGKIIARPGSSPRILLFTAVLMLLQNPKELVFDASFQLTFLAMLALIYVVPLMQSYLTRVPEKWGFRTLLATSLGVQIAVFPYILYSMGNFSTVFLLSNLLILFVVPVTMLIGFAATLLAYVSTVLAWPLAYVSHLLLAWILFVARFLGNLSWASVQIQNFPLWLTLLLYAVLLSALYALTNQESASLKTPKVFIQTLFSSR